MTPQQNKTLHRAISIFGKQNQKMQSIEELMELQKALFENVHRGTDNRVNIVEEMADVEIMLAQLRDIYNVKEEELNKIKDYKIGRLDHTIEKYLNKEKQSNIVQPVKEVHIDRNTSNGR